MTDYERLQALVGMTDPFTGEPFAQIITNVHDHDGACEDAPYPVTHPRHFILHAMTVVEEVDDKGSVTVKSAEGDWVYGKPDAVLRRVSEAARAGM